MKIVHVYKDYFPVYGGIENHVRLLAEAEAAQGHQVTVLVTSRGRHTESTTVNGVRLIKAARLWHIASTPISLALPVTLARLRPDIAHLHFPYPLGEASQYFLGHARRTLITYHSDIVRQKRILQLYRPLLWRVLRRADRIIATSPQYAASSPFLSRLAGRVTVIPLGIDPAPFLAPLRTTGPVPQQLDSLPKDSIRLLFVGKSRYYKGIDTLLEALTALPGASLLLVGDGPMRGAWQALAHKLHLAGRVHFAGEVASEDLAAYYRAADIFVLPANSRAEAFGLVQLEAMASGLPVVCTEVHSGTSFVNEDGVTGFVVPPRRPELLRRALQKLIEDPDLRSKMGAAGRERMLRHFTAGKMVEQTLSLYEALLRR